MAKLQQELYVDDLISGSTSVERARELKGKASAVFEDAGFKLHKWHSNVQELESDPSLAGEPTYAKEQLAAPDGEDCSLLGVKWHKERDTMSIAVP